MKDLKLVKEHKTDPNVIERSVAGSVDRYIAYAISGWFYATVNVLKYSFIIIAFDTFDFDHIIDGCLEKILDQSKDGMGSTRETFEEIET